MSYTSRYAIGLRVVTGAGAVVGCSLTRVRVQFIAQIVLVLKSANMSISYTAHLEEAQRDINSYFEKSASIVRVNFEQCVRGTVRLDA